MMPRPRIIKGVCGPVANKIWLNHTLCGLWKENENISFLCCSLKYTQKKKKKEMAKPPRDHEKPPENRFPILRNL